MKRKWIVAHYTYKPYFADGILGRCWLAKKFNELGNWLRKIISYFTYEVYWIDDY